MPSPEDRVKPGRVIPARQRRLRKITAHYLPLSVLMEDNKDVVVYQKDRPQGLYIIGSTGTGKSTLLANLILTDIKQGLGVCLIEPHGDLTNTVLAGIPDSRAVRRCVSGHD